MLPPSYELPAALLLLLGGALACVAGYRLFRTVLAIYGFILGAMLASSLMGVTNTTGMVVAAVAGAGKAVFCEKPVGGTPEHVLHAAGAARAAGVISGVGYNYRWAPLVQYARELLADGAGGIGYLLKERIADLDQLTGALAAVAAGGSVLDPKVVESLVARRRGGGQSPLAELSPRELEVLQAMATG